MTATGIRLSDPSGTKSQRCGWSVDNDQLQHHKEQQLQLQQLPPRTATAAQRTATAGPAMTSLPDLNTLPGSAAWEAEEAALVAQAQRAIDQHTEESELLRKRTAVCRIPLTR